MRKFRTIGVRPNTTHRGLASLTSQVFEVLAGQRRGVGMSIPAVASRLGAKIDSVRKACVRLQDDGYLVRNEGELPHLYFATKKFETEGPRHIGPQRTIRARA